MDIKAELEKLDSLIAREISTLVPVHVATKAEWAAIGETLAALVAEAQRLGLPWGKVGEYTTRLKHHLGALLGAVADDGHSREQHTVWALGDMQALRSWAAFGPALRRLSQSPSGSLH
jgi:hypothetical protein